MRAHAQGPAVLRGTVADSASGQPVAGVSETRRLTVALPGAVLRLSEVSVSQPQDPNQSLAAISRIDQVLRPLNSAQDLLRLVPGLFIAQHAGGGKAEQIFLRGFDCDHGTDFAVSIDGLPVNMVSHAHGQGYADFHFVIPETVAQLKVYKGPYTARFGDFATAGAGEFLTKTRLEHSQVKVELGQFDTRRALVLLDLLGGGNGGARHLLSKRPESAYVAAEYYFTNSYFDAAQHFVPVTGDALLEDFQAYAADPYTLFASEVTGAFDRPDALLPDDLADAKLGGVGLDCGQGGAVILDQDRARGAAAGCATRGSTRGRAGRGRLPNDATMMHRANCC